MTSPGLAPQGSLASLLVARAAENPTFPLLWVDGAGPWTTGEVARTSAHLAQRLRDAGVARNERVLVRFGNDERFLAAVTAVWELGSSAVAVHPKVPPAELKGVIQTTSPAAIVVGDEDQVDSSVPLLHLPRVSHGVTAVPPVTVPDIDDDVEALVLLTSGSTGAAKGVSLSHRAAWESIRATLSAFRTDTLPGPLPSPPRAPNLLVSPMSHTAGIVRLLFGLYVGRGVVTMRKFDARRVHTAVHEHGMRNLTINPAMMRDLLDELESGEDLGQVRYVSSGAAPLPASLRQAFEERFGIPVLQTYGQTEAFGAVAVESVRDVLAGRRRPASVGKPLPGVDVRIVDGYREVSPGEEGEIVVRTPSLALGYVGSGTPSIDEAGWLRTGDLGHLDQDGYLFVTGRRKNVIICGGFNIVPEELEEELERIDGVREALVVGLEQARLGEVPVAVVVADVSPDEIETAIRSAVAPYKLPREILRVDELPRLPNGKADRAAARDLASARIQDNDVEKTSDQPSR